MLWKINATSYDCVCLMEILDEFCLGRDSGQESFDERGKILIASDVANQLREQLRAFIESIQDK